MSTICVEQPSGNLLIKRDDCIGKFYAIEHQGQCYAASCIDSSEGKPKRMRIQRDIFLGGNVLMPHEYKIMEAIDGLDD